jgi:signal transduction histidine kinase
MPGEHMKEKKYHQLLGIRFVRYCREEKERRHLLREPDGGRGNSRTAVAATLAEREYREIIEALGERCRDLATEWQKERQESLDYYSTWVHQIKTPIAVMRIQLQGEDTDEKWLLFIIEQLLSNAIKYTPNGTVSINIL